jgi:MATE efflux family protein
MAKSLNVRNTHGEVRMTDGSLWKNMLIFSAPLMLSQLLQVLFNMADVAIVGKYSSAEALGAVGSTTILVTLFTGFLIGMGSAVNVRVAQHLGAKDKARTAASIRTSFVLCLATGCIIMALCLVSARFMLELIGTKDDLIEGAVLYFRIYALGMPALGIFNFGNGVLSANGDTKRPLLYLMIAGILNVIFNLFFVIVCGMAEDGVALASIITQYVSAVLILIHMGRQGDNCTFHFKDLKNGIDRPEGKCVLELGIPAGLQNAIFAIANLFIQGAVNSFESVMVEGNSAAANADAIIYNVMAAFYTACSTFMGQNMGAAKRDRVLKSYFIGIVYSFTAGAVLGAALFLFGEEFLSLFANDRAVIEAGLQRTGIMCFSYAFSAFMDCTIAACRGIGKSFAPTVIVIMGSCVFRVVWIYTVFAYFRTIPSLYLLYIFSWVITSVAEIVYFAISYKKLNTADVLKT